MKIGFLDSGLGGLSVLAHALQALPGVEFLYYADSLNAPYGNKPKEQVLELVASGVDFLIGNGAEAIVLACNTATSIAAEFLRARYDLPILGMEPAVKPALEICRPQDLRVLVTATPLTCREKKMRDLLEAVDPEGMADLVPLPGLVELAEAHVFDDGVVLAYLEEAFAGLDKSQYGSVVLGCTHFPFFASQFRQLFPQAVLIDGAPGTVRHLCHTLQISKPSSTKPQVTYFLSKNKVDDPALIEKYQQLMDRVAAG